MMSNNNWALAANSRCPIIFLSQNMSAISDSQQAMPFPCVCLRRPKPLKTLDKRTFLQRIASKHIRSPIISVNRKMPQTPWQSALRAAVTGIGAEKRQCLSPAPLSAYRKVGQKRSKPPGSLSLLSRVPPRPHGGSQGRTRGFCGAILCCQLLLGAVTFSGHLCEVQLVLVVLRQHLSHRQNRVEQ